MFFLLHHPLLNLFIKAQKLDQILYEEISKPFYDIHIKRNFSQIHSINYSTT